MAVMWESEDVDSLTLGKSLLSESQFICKMGVSLELAQVAFPELSEDETAK